MRQSSPRVLYDPAASGPAYRQLARSIGEAIVRGDLAAGAALPTERGLAEDLGLSRVTVRAAYRALVEDGLIEARAGSGNYVRGATPAFEQPLWQLSSFSEDMARRGRDATSRLLDLTRGEATDDELAALTLKSGDGVVRLSRLRLVDGEPLGIEVASLPEALTQAVQLGEGSLYAALSAQGLAPARGIQRMRAVSLDEEVAGLLGVPAGSAAMLLERVSFLADDTPIEYTKSHYRGDAYGFVAKLDGGDLT